MYIFILYFLYIFSVPFINIKENRSYLGRTSLIQRLEAGRCELCGDENTPIEIHHVRKLKDLQGKKFWETLMIARRRKTLATGNPYIKEKMDLDIQVSKLKLLKANHTSQRYRLEDNITQNYPKQIVNLKEQLAGYEADMQTYQKNKPIDKESFTMKIGNKVFTSRKEAGTALIEMCKNAKTSNLSTVIGEFAGFQLGIAFDSFFSKLSVTLKGKLKHEVEIGPDAIGNLQRISNLMDAMVTKIAEIRQKLSNVEHQLETAKIEVTKPFPQEAELKEKMDRLTMLNALLNMDEKVK